MAQAEFPIQHLWQAGPWKQEVSTFAERRRVMLKPREIAGKTLALLAYHVLRDEWVVYTGVVRLEEGLLFLERGDGSRFEVREEWWDRILVVEHDMAREILRGADLCLPLTMGDKPEHWRPNDFVETGFKSDTMA